MKIYLDINKTIKKINKEIINYSYPVRHLTNQLRQTQMNNINNQKKRPHKQESTPPYIPPNDDSLINILIPTPRGPDDVWAHRSSREPYDKFYDWNDDGQVNYQDAGLAYLFDISTASHKVKPVQISGPNKNAFVVPNPTPQDIWDQRNTPVTEPYDKLPQNLRYDVNRDGKINYQDAGLAYLASIQPKTNPVEGIDTNTNNGPSKKINQSEKI